MRILQIAGMIYMRTSRKKYLIAKYVSAFVSGGLATVLPLLLNLVCAMMLSPNHPPAAVLPQITADATCVFYKLCYSRPTLYIVIFLCIDFILGGMWSCVALVSSFLSDYKIVVAICPFFVQLGIHVVCTMLNSIEYSSVYFAQAGYGIHDMWGLVIYFCVGIGTTYIVFIKQSEKADIF